MRIRNFAFTVLTAAALALAVPVTAQAQITVTPEITPTPVTNVSGFAHEVVPVSGKGATDTEHGVAKFKFTFASTVDAYVKIPNLTTAATDKFVEITDATVLEFTLDINNGLRDENNEVKVYAQAATDGSPSGDYGELVKTYIVYMDRVAPNAPGNISAEGADEIILVNWDSPTKSGTEFFDQYIITYSETDFSSMTTAEAAALETKTVDAVGENEATIDGLTNGTTYYISVRTVDWAGNVSDFPKGESGGILTVTAEPVITLSLAELAGEEGGCFIATAAYGSYQAPHVKVLRQFRDQVLLSTGAGARFVDWYYRTSPAYAVWIAKHDTARAVARVLLLPAYALAYLFLHPVWALLAGLAVLGFAAARYALPRREVAR